MGRLFEFILFAVVAYFVFKFLNRLFSNPSSNSNNTSRTFKSREPQNKPSSRNDIKWDAETVDYEEVEPRDNEKK